MDNFSANLNKTRKLCDLNYLLDAIGKVDDYDSIESIVKRLYADACAEAVAAVHLVKMFDFVD